MYLKKHLIITFTLITFLLNLFEINCQRYSYGRNRNRGNGETVRPLDSSEEPTEISERRGSGRRRDPESHPFVTTMAQESGRGTEVVNVNLNVKDRRKKNRRNRRRRNRLRQPQRQRQPPTLIQRLGLLFNPSGQGFSSGYTPLFSRLFRPYSNNFNNRFPNGGNGRRRGRPQRPFTQ